MADFDSEREQIEALKKWWRENGRVVVLGLVLGLGGVFGWQWWQSYTIGNAERASRTYEELINWASEDNHARVNELAEVLMRDHAGSAYAALGAMVRASSAFTQGRADEARAFLQWVVDNAPREQVSQLARLRLAAIASDKGDHAGALALLDQGSPGTLMPAFEELRGDIKLAQGDRAGAGASYRDALSSPDLSPSSRARVRMKLHDLGLSPSGEPEV